MPIHNRLTFMLIGQFSILSTKPSNTHRPEKDDVCASAIRSDLVPTHRHILMDRRCSDREPGTSRAHRLQRMRSMDLGPEQAEPWTPGPGVEPTREGVARQTDREVVRTWHQEGPGRASKPVCAPQPRGRWDWCQQPTKSPLKAPQALGTAGQVTGG